MTIDLTPDPTAAGLAAQTAEFIRDVVLSMEAEYKGVVPSDAVRAELQRAAKDRGVFAPHVSTEYSGHGLDMRGRAAVFEEAGYSLLGPLALNIAAPDEGNMHMLEAIATPEQREHYLRPLAGGDVRSCFAMTEPAPGAGSDPSALTTRAVRVDGGLILQACWELDQGRSAAQSTAIAKTFCAEAIWRVVDRSVQICGSLGISGDVLLGRFLREVRPFRIYDGPSETHRWAIARRVVRRHDQAGAR